MNLTGQRGLAVAIALAVLVVAFVAVLSNSVLSTPGVAPSVTIAARPTAAVSAAPPATASAAPLVTPTVVAPGRSPAPVTTSPTPAPIQMPTSALLSAPSANVVWVEVGGQRLFRSGDRGDTWEERPLPSGASNAGISFVDEREGWVVSTDPGAPPCAQTAVRLWHTADGGATYDGGVAPPRVSNHASARKAHPSSTRSAASSARGPR